MAEELEPQQLVDILEQLRGCRAALMADAEAFQKAAVAVEHVAQIAGAPIGRGLGRSRHFVFKIIRFEDEATQQRARALFDIVRDARNDAVHDGAWVRHRSEQLIELLLIFEEAILHQLTVVKHMMVKSVVTAEPWHSLARVRREILTYSFSFLPVDMEAWMLLSDEAIVAVTRSTSPGERNRRLALSIQTAIDELGLKLSKADSVDPNLRISDLARQRRNWPLMVTENGDTSGRLLGILTPFDLL